MDSQGPGAGRLQAGEFEPSRGLRIDRETARQPLSSEADRVHRELEIRQSALGSEGSRSSEAPTAINHGGDRTCPGPERVRRTYRSDEPKLRCHRKRNAPGI